MKERKNEDFLIDTSFFTRKKNRQNENRFLTEIYNNNILHNFSFRCHLEYLEQFLNGINLNLI